MRVAPLWTQGACLNVLKRGAPVASTAVCIQNTDSRVPRPLELGCLGLRGRVQDDVRGQGEVAVEGTRVWTAGRARG